MMLVPKIWNVIVAGRWNPALFTPAAISTRVFGLEEGTPVEVYLSVDDILPPQVVHNGLKVIGSAASLEVVTVRSSHAEIKRAMQVAVNELRTLGVTPVRAAGINFRYGAPNLPEPLLDKFSQDLDDLFADQGLELTGKGFRRKLRFSDGTLLITVDAPSGNNGAELLFNFERRSAKPDDLAAWLSQTTDSFAATVTKVMEGVFGLTEGIHYVREVDGGDDGKNIGNTATIE